MLRQGAFGGTYFRPIASAVTNVRYNSQKVLKDTVEDEWIKGLTMNKLTSSTYQKHINKFGVKCGGSLGSTYSDYFNDGNFICLVVVMYILCCIVRLQLSSQFSFGLNKFIR